MDKERNIWLKMTRQEIITLSKSRLEQAIENLEEAEGLFEINKYKGANNRAYYSIFHSIKSILALEKTDFKKHSSVISYFNKNYINENIFPRKLGKMISRATYIREKCDYDDFYVVSREDTIEQIETAKLLIEEVRKYTEDKYIN